MPSKVLLPPIPSDSFDGEKQSTEIKFNRCTHEKIAFKNGELRCPCGVAYQGHNLQDIYKLLHK